MARINNTSMTSRLECRGGDVSLAWPVFVRKTKTFLWAKTNQLSRRVIKCLAKMISFSVEALHRKFLCQIIHEQLNTFSGLRSNTFFLSLKIRSSLSLLHSSTHTYIYSNTYIQAHTYKHIHTNTYMQSHTCKHIHSNTYIQTNKETYIQTHKYKQIKKHTLKHIHILALTHSALYFSQLICNTYIYHLHTHPSRNS